MKPSNVIVFMSDEHNKRILGCYGNKLVKTPHLDKMAANGTRFENAYTNCPICVPARASFQTGQYVNKIGYWDNALPYDGQVKGWGHRLIDEGHEVVSVGKLHFRSSEDPNGFSREIIPMHVVDGKGDIQASLRNPPVERPGSRLIAEKTGYGISHYQTYDEDVTAQSIAWLKAKALEETELPWVLYVSWVRPHFPMIAEDRFQKMYPPEQMPMPHCRDAADIPSHPVTDKFREIQCADDFFENDLHRQTALSAYYGMVTSVDEELGKVLSVLEETGLKDETRLIYTSDHGDNMGARQLWGKSVPYEDSIAIPMIISGPDIPANNVIETPVSLVDVYQTIIDYTGKSLTTTEQTDLPGASLQRIATGEHQDRDVLIEYHAVASMTGYFVLRHKNWKLVYYEGYSPQLFDLGVDPFEKTDLSKDDAHATILEMLQHKLRQIVDTEAVNNRAFSEQAALIEKHGGVDAVRRLIPIPHTPAPGEKRANIKLDG